MKFLAQYALWRDTVDVVAVHESGGRRWVGANHNIVMQEHDANAVMEPTLSLTPDQARSLLQALWDAGIRPAENTDRSGEVAALKQHIGFAEHVAKALLQKGEA